jgi:hypothetical protein
VALLHRFARKSQVFIGPCSESVFVRDCSNCTFTVACKQLRVRDCADCVFNLYAKTDPIIESSRNLQFAPFNGQYDGIDEHFRRANLDRGDDHWDKVYDFATSAVGYDASTTPLNWSILAPEERQPVWAAAVPEGHTPDCALEALAVGMQVEARYGGQGVHFKGEVQAASADGQRFHLVYEDGDQELQVERFRIRLHAGQREPRALPVGTVVDARFGGGDQFFRGRVVGVTAEQAYHVEFDDGDMQRDTARDHVHAQVTPGSGAGYVDEALVQALLSRMMRVDNWMMKVRLLLSLTLTIALPLGLAAANLQLRTCSCEYVLHRAGAPAAAALLSRMPEP